MRSGDVYIVDDDAAVRDSMAALLLLHGFRTRQFGSAAEFLAASAALPPGCVILDIRMPHMTGIELQRELSHAGCEHAILFVTAHGDIPLAVHAMKAGARDFIEKPFDDGALLTAVRNALSPVSRPNANAKAVAALAQLSEREREVLKLVVDGMTSKAIAEALGISVRTVEIHRGNLLAKTGSQNVAQLVRLALAGGIGSAAADQS
jgi:two-component system response regulator FixJ